MSTHEHAGAFVAWGAHTSRADELARCCGVPVLRTEHARLTGRGSAPMRWAVDAFRTVRWLRRIRPAALVVQNPPALLVLLALAWRRATGGRLLLDSHPVSFGRKNSRFWSLFLPLQRVASRRAAAVLVTVEELADEVRSWGGHALIVHEPPPADQHVVGGPPASTERPTALFIGVFAADEPVDAVVDAAAQAPEIEFAITGDTARAEPVLLRRAGDNVTFTGFLGAKAFADALGSASTVLALTTEPTSVIRAAYEATYAERPLVTSDTPVLRETFPAARHVPTDAAAIAAAVRHQVGPAGPGAGALAEAKRLQMDRWDRQISALRSCLGVGDAGSP